MVEGCRERRSYSFQSHKQQSNCIKTSNHRTLKHNNAATHWEKVLWRKQGYPDNYSGGKERFLAELRKNVSVVLYTREEATRAGIHFLLHLNLLLLSLLFFEFIQCSSTSLVHLSCSSLSVVVMVYTSYMLFLREDPLSPSEMADHACTLVTITSLGYSLIPIIRTLTTTISTDSIYAMAISADVISCVFHDYGVNTPIVSRPLSLSAGLSSSVLLISRLDDNPRAFIYLCLSFLLHAYGFTVRNVLNATHPNLMVFLSALVSIGSTLLLSFNLALSVCWGLFHFFVIIVCPQYLVYLQRGKRTIHGPWDEAVLRRTI